MATHILKTWPEPFCEVWGGRKKFEVRKDDRNYQVSDRLTLVEYEPSFEVTRGRMVEAKVTCILRGGQFGIEDGFVVMGIEVLTMSKPF